MTGRQANRRWWLSGGFVRHGGLLCALVMTFMLAGCQLTTKQGVISRTAALASLGSKPAVVIRPVERHHGIGFANRISKTIPEPSERTQLLLRKYDLETSYDKDPDAVIRWLEELVKNRPTMEEIHGLAEIAELHANWSSETGDGERANRLYSIALVHAYQFLFDNTLDIGRNAYDPQFRSICDIYNRSLESILRQVCKAEHIQPGSTFEVGTESQGIQFHVELDGRWLNQEFTRFELVNDYETHGVTNHYHTYGLGVPLIAVRQQQELQSDFEKYYPNELTLPMTAFAHLDHDGPQEKSTRRYRARLKLYDPLEKTFVKAESKVIPLESDITTPLAYSLRDPLVSKGVIATASLLDAGFAADMHGMYMIEPYDPNKIPVVMVHGLWSSPFTWLHMFNDLRANPDIRENYQFWFYSYPTGQPFWISAAKMRSDLAKIKRDVDPRGDSKAMDQMILVGHSMGGLISLLQTMESEDHFWGLISDASFDEFEGDPEALEKLKDTFFFHPNPSIDRVITIATPLKGSEFANAATRWVSHRLFTLPTDTTSAFGKLAKQNSEQISDAEFLTTTTSIDSLAPGNPVFEAIAKSQRNPSVEVHNVFGRISRKHFLKSASDSPKLNGDGVVSVQSSQNDSADSEIAVEAEHVEVHQHPACIFEVRRVLFQNLARYDRIRVREIPQIPQVRQAKALEPIKDHSEALESTDSKTRMR